MTESICETCQHSARSWDGGIECRLALPPWLALAIDNSAGEPFLSASRRVSRYDTCHFWKIDSELGDELHREAYNDALQRRRVERAGR